METITNDMDIVKRIKEIELNMEFRDITSDLADLKGVIKQAECHYGYFDLSGKLTHKSYFIEYNKELNKIVLKITVME